MILIYILYILTLCTKTRFPSLVAAKRMTWVWFLNFVWLPLKAWTRRNGPSQAHRFARALAVELAVLYFVVARKKIAHAVWNDSRGWGEFMESFFWNHFSGIIFGGGWAPKVKTWPLRMESFFKGRCY